MTEKKGEWSNPTRRRDEHYEAKMQEMFAPEQERPRTNGARHPLREDSTAVLPPVAPRPNGAAPGQPQRVPQGDAETGELKARRRILPIALACAAALLVLFVGYRIVFGGEAGGEASEPPAGAPGGAAQVSMDAGTPKETNLVFRKPVEGQDDSYTVGLGEYEWEGTKKLNGDVEEVVLEGRTAANFTTAVRLAEGEITTGVFGRAEPEKPMWQATFLRTTTGGRETTTGNYHAVDGGQVILEGSYFDRVVEDNPGDEADDIVRTYVEGDPRDGGGDLTRYSVIFHAPEGTEIPWLPGWREPAPEPGPAR